MAETCTALYDYEAQAEGDLSFTAGEVIEIVQRGASENEWWTGKVAGRQGQFPGEFCQVRSYSDIWLTSCFLAGNYVQVN